MLRRSILIIVVVVLLHTLKGDPKETAVLPDLDTSVDHQCLLLTS